MDTRAPHRKRNKKYNIPGHAHFLTFSCYRRIDLLTNDTWRQWLAESIRGKCDEHKIALWAYVFMPEHVHLLLKPLREIYDLWLELGRRADEPLRIDVWDDSLVICERPGTALNSESGGTRTEMQAANGRAN